MSRPLISVLIGAGFSKSLFREMPSMKELTKTVMEDEEVSRQLRKLDTQLPLFEGKSLEEVNIEDWIQILEESGAYFKDPSIVDRRKLIVRLAMQTISKELQLISNNLEFTDTQLALFERLFKAKVNIITTNYDLIFEMALAALIRQERIEVGTPYDLNFGLLQMAYMRKNETYLSAGVTDVNNFSRIFKLHGSCDWFTPEINSSELIFTDTSVLGDHFGETLNTQSRYICEMMSPVMAGPNSLKRELINSRPLHPIWLSAYSALRGTSMLFVYGSSLHRTDATLNSLIIEGIPPSVGVEIYDLNPSSVKNRMKNLIVDSRIYSKSTENVNFEYFVNEVCAYAEASTGRIQVDT